jgi:hypothetical protein
LLDAKTLKRNASRENSRLTRRLESVKLSSNFVLVDVNERIKYLTWLAMSKPWRFWSLSPMSVTPDMS